MKHVSFNAECPICNAEICHYRSYADRCGILMEFDDLNQTDLSFYGVDQEAAARRLHVFHEGKVISGGFSFCGNLGAVAAIQMACTMVWLTDHSSDQHSGLRPYSGTNLIRDAPATLKRVKKRMICYYRSPSLSNPTPPTARVIQCSLSQGAALDQRKSDPR